jgi:hypothetical protein
LPPAHLRQDSHGVENVTAGPATITLPLRPSSYFDEYLDEITYFSETNKNRDIVVIEGLNQFNDATISESLRSLNLDPPLHPDRGDSTARRVPSMCLAR